MQNGALNFIHLSDIHFNKSSDSTYDLDLDLRREIENDLRLMKSAVGHYSGILITGDVAYSASEDQYSKAFDWIEQICKIADIELNYVWITPGNHDVDWGSIQDNQLYDYILKDLKAQDETTIDQWLARTASDPSLVQILNTPHEKFNRFASKFLCETDFKKPFWQADLELNDRSILRIRGLNSALFSNEADSDKKLSDKLPLHSAWCLAPNEEGVTYLSMCHHPLNWMRNEKVIADAMNARLKIQLFGHEHILKISKIDDILRIHAGAVHPDRAGNFTGAHYNIVSIEVVTNSQNQRNLKVRTFTREYNYSKARFEKGRSEGSNECHEHYLPLSSFSEPSKRSPEKSVPIEENSGVSEMPEIQIQQSLKLLAIHMSKLGFPTQIAIAQKLGLFQSGDELLNNTKRFRKFLDRAKECGILHEFWEEVSKESDFNLKNPFTKMNENKGSEIK